MYEWLPDEFCLDSIQTMYNTLLNTRVEIEYMVYANCKCLKRGNCVVIFKLIFTSPSNPGI